jgi:hypothetical protein
VFFSLHVRDKMNACNPQKDLPGFFLGVLRSEAGSGGGIECDFDPCGVGLAAVSAV